MSYISRNILATTYDDGLFGSDIFPIDQTLLNEYSRIEKLVKALCSRPDLPNTPESAVALEAAAESLEEETFGNSVITNELKVRVEQSSCMNPGCPGPVQVTVFLSWNNSRVVAPEQHRNSIYKKAVDVTAADVLASLPARWTIESWATGTEFGMVYPRPRFQVNDRVRVFFGPKEEVMGAAWERFEQAVIKLVGYREDTWNTGVYITYVVEMVDGRLLTVITDDERVVPDTTKRFLTNAEQGIQVTQDNGGLEFV